MSDIAIKVENLSKLYHIGSKKSGSLRESLMGMFKGKQDLSNDFWALKDVSFEIKKGDAVGIIGKNGAGKSTLLKILSRITEPTRGVIDINGRVSSLLEVGTGFHPELTGRENIYLNGTILGMTRKEVKRKFDEIVDFSGIKKFLDTPVKHYSSGMYVRLAFAVAAHLEPEILIIDEVLAVGDAEFQKKCLGKMNEVSKNEGRTVIFVSHNLAAVSQLCSNGILLKEGELVIYSEINTAISEYILFKKLSNKEKTLLNVDQRKGSGLFRVKTITLLDENKNEIRIGRTGSTLIFKITFDKTIKRTLGAFRIDFAIDDERDSRIAWFSSEAVKSKIDEEFENIFLKIPMFPIGSGVYFLTFYITINGHVVDYIHQGYQFEIEEGNFFGTGRTIPKSQTNFYIKHLIES